MQSSFHVYYAKNYLVKSSKQNRKAQTASGEKKLKTGDPKITSISIFRIQME